MVRVCMQVSIVLMRGRGQWVSVNDRITIPGYQCLQLRIDGCGVLIALHVYKASAPSIHKYNAFMKERGIIRRDIHRTLREYHTWCEYALE